MSSISIRRATSGDGSVITDFNARLAEETEGRTLDRDLLRRGVRQLLNDPAKGEYFLAESEGHVVGQLMTTYEWSDWRNGCIWWIQSVYIRSEYRKQGIFRGLYEHLLQEAKARGDVVGLRLYVDKDNDAAQKTYERMGMKKSAYEMFELELPVSAT